MPLQPRSAILRSFAVVLSLAGLAGCAGQPAQTETQVDAHQVAEAQQYRAHAKGDYRAPGPASDPWGPYVQEASTRFDVPREWIRQVMRVESGGELFHGDTLTTSYKGAMGLMQVMPGTYDELRDRYTLGDDPFDPYNNIIAGTAYLREMYDIYGSPGMLAAYNGGPKRLDDYLANFRSLPDETRHYVAMIAPYIEGIYPRQRSSAEDYAMNDLPSEIPPGLRYGGGEVTPSRHAVRVASRGHGTTQVAMAVESRRKGRAAESRTAQSHGAEPTVRTASALVPARGAHGATAGASTTKAKQAASVSAAAPARKAQTAHAAPAASCAAKSGTARRTCA